MRKQRLAAILQRSALVFAAVPPPIFPETQVCPHELA